MNAMPDFNNGFTCSTLRERREFLLRAHGSVLVNGGGNAFLRRLAQKPNVDFITVVERDADDAARRGREIPGLGDKVTFVVASMDRMVKRHVYDAVLEQGGQ